MFYYFRFRDQKDNDLEFYSDEDINNIPIYEASEDLNNEFSNDPDSDLWFIYDPTYASSTNPVECRNEIEARSYLARLLNLGVYERVYDI